MPCLLSSQLAPFGVEVEAPAQGGSRFVALGAQKRTPETILRKTCGETL